MKVIQVMPNFALAGAEIMCENLIYELRRQGIEVIAVSFFNERTAITERLEKNEVKIIYLGKKPAWDFSIIKKLRKVFKQEKPDVIHTNRYAPIYAIPAAILAGVKCRVHIVHNVAQKENKRIGRFFNKIFFKLFHTIPVALSELIQESIEKEYKIKKKKIPVILNGIDLSKCQPKADYAIKDKIKILHIGRFSPQKNHKGLIEAFHLFHQEYPQSILQLIGEGELREEVKKQVNQLGLTASVELLGLQENVHAYLHSADIFTLPSNYEGIPITLIEAMGTGLPIVATNVGGIPDMLQDGENTILTTLSTSEIAEAFFTFASDERLRKKMGEKAKAEAEKFSDKRMTEGYLTIYRRRNK